MRALLWSEATKEQNNEQQNSLEELASARQDLEAAIGHYLRSTCAYFDTHKNVEVKILFFFYLNYVLPITVGSAEGVYTNLGYPLRLSVPAEVPSIS